MRQIKGNWAGVGQTTYTVSMWGFTAPFVASIWTLATADGAGNISGSGSVNLMGLLLPLEFTNVYTVTRDCGYSDVVYNDYGGAHSTGVIFGVEPNLEVVTVGTDPAQVSVTTRRRM